MILIAGLGNPGPKYSKTRHNVGFVAMDSIAYKWQAEFKYEKKFNAEIAEISRPEVSTEAILIAKPHTFMNNSGEAIQKIAHFYKIHPENIWIIYDDVDLPLGQLKIRKTGGPGTHNGMKSIVTHIGKDFPRFRIGIESRGQSASILQDTESFVLSEFFASEKEILVNSINNTVQSIELALKIDLGAAMNQFN